MSGIEDRLLSRREVEQRFGITKRYMETAAGRNEGPKIIRIGRMVKFRASDIRAWIEEHSTAGEVR